MDERQPLRAHWQTGSGLAAVPSHGVLGAVAEAILGHGSYSDSTGCCGTSLDGRSTCGSAQAQAIAISMPIGMVMEP